MKAEVNAHSVYFFNFVGISNARDLDVAELTRVIFFTRAWVLARTPCPYLCPCRSACHKSMYYCYTGRRQTNYLIRWTQANQLSNELTIINQRLQGQQGGLQLGI